ncbi:MAG: hypothetical protein PF501_19760 [Salinisphaera sp.]|nr:hypothetical protein [Salinisphaera sp.]
MISLKRVIALLVIGAALSSIGGCAFLRGSATGSSFVTSDMWHLRLPGTDAPGQNAVGYRSPYGYEEYDRSTANGRTEAISFYARRPGIALEISPERLESLTRRWNFNGHDARLSWAQEPGRRIIGTSIAYRLYRRQGPGSALAVACVAFIRTWAVAGDDPYLRPTRAYFGYHCRLPGQALSAATALDYLRGIKVTSSSVPDFYIGQTVPHDPAALARASGTDDAVWGIRGFPLDRFRHYPIGGAVIGGGAD